MFPDSLRHVANRGRRLDRVLKKFGIRSLMSRRIPIFIKGSVQNLKRELFIAGASTFIPLALIGATQATRQTTLGPEVNRDSGADSSPEEEYAVIYVRVSSNEQTDGRSIPAQIDALESIADNYDVTLRTEPIRDEGESGTDFNRDGIMEVFRLALEGKISYLFVDDIDRLGRTHAQTLYFIHCLTQELDVEIVTQDGELGFSQMNGKMEATWKTLASEWEVMDHGKDARRSKAKGFLEEKNWSSWYRTVPFGYEESDDWIGVNTELKNSAETMFEAINETRCYADTADQVNATCDEEFHVSASQVKRHLQNPVYVGEPSIPIEQLPDYDHKGFVDDPDLQIIDQETFETTQETIEEITRRNSSKESEADVRDYVDQFGLFLVNETSPVVTLQCPRCGSRVVRDGQAELDMGMDAHHYRCTNEECNVNRKWPLEAEAELVELLQEENIEKLISDR